VKERKKQHKIGGRPSRDLAVVPLSAHRVEPFAIFCHTAHDTPRDSMSSWFRRSSVLLGADSQTPLPLNSFRLVQLILLVFGMDAHHQCHHATSISCETIMANVLRAG